MGNDKNRDFESEEACRLPWVLSLEISLLNFLFCIKIIVQFLKKPSNTL